MSGEEAKSNGGVGIMGGGFDSFFSFKNSIILFDIHFAFRKIK